MLQDRPHGYVAVTSARVLTQLLRRKISYQCVPCPVTIPGISMFINVCAKQGYTPRKDWPHQGGKIHYKRHQMLRPIPSPHSRLALPVAMSRVFVVILV